jgi:hypothetical protein
MQHQDGALADELARARRRAFSRGATPGDLEHLRALEARVPAEPASRDAPDVSAEAHVVPLEGPDVAPDAVEPTHSHDEPVGGRSRPRWIRPATLGLLVGILVGLLVAVVASPLLGLAARGVAILDGAPQNSGTGPSLAIFDRTPSERDVLGAAGLPPIFGSGSGTPEVRWLADLDGATIYAARGEQGGEPMICLVAIQASEAGASCSPVADFEIAGIWGTFDGLAVRWGPTGTAAWVPYEPEAR